jgi:hypothetical protein
LNAVKERFKGQGLMAQGKGSILNAVKERFKGQWLKAQGK